MMAALIKQGLYKKYMLNYGTISLSIKYNIIKHTINNIF